MKSGDTSVSTVSVADRLALMLVIYSTRFLEQEDTAGQFLFQVSLARENVIWRLYAERQDHAPSHFQLIDIAAGSLGNRLMFHIVHFAPPFGSVVSGSIIGAGEMTLYRTYTFYNGITMFACILFSAPFPQVSHILCLHRTPHDCCKLFVIMASSTLSTEHTADLPI